MIEVSFTASTAGASCSGGIERGLGRHLRLRPRCQDKAPNLARLHVTSRPLPGPFVVNPKRGVVVSTWDSGGICRYAGIELTDYLLIASLLALSQWRVLHYNPLLRIDDLQHPPGIRCLFAGPHRVQEFALLLDPPVVCRGCTDFYHCLGAESELIALRQVIREIFMSQTRASTGDATPRQN